MRATALSFAACVVTLAAGAADSSSAPRDPGVALGSIGVLGAAPSTIDGSVRIETRFRTATKGTFRIRGAISDTGSFAATRRVSGGRLQLTETLRGAAGTIRIRATRSCSGGSGTWRVLSGSKAYAGLSGGGAASGGGRCVSPKYPTQASYRGVVRTPPPPPLAQPGRFGGGTSQREEVILDVGEDGRTLSGLRLRVTTPCEGTTITAQVFISLPGPYEIGADKSFSLTSSASVSKSSVTGRFTSPTTVEGTATASTTLTLGSTNTTHACSADVTWSASQPPPAATPGTYCGFTDQGPSICFDVAPSGREVTRVEVGVIVRCLQQGVDFELTLTFAASAIGGHLGFRKSEASFEGLVSGTGFVSGLIDPGGSGASGSVFLQLPVFDFEGTRYSCRNASSRWTARRQA